MSAREERAAEILAEIPYAAFLGVRGPLDGEEMVLALPFTDDLIGNPRLPAVHGGALGAFLEITAQVRVRLEQAGKGAPATIGVTVEYLRPARDRDTYARAQIKRLGRRIANVHVEAWQDSNRTPVALLQAKFLMPEVAAVPRGD